MANWGLRVYSDKRPVDRYFRQAEDDARKERNKQEERYNGSNTDYCPHCGRIYYNCVCGHDDEDEE